MSIETRKRDYRRAPLGLRVPLELHMHQNTRNLHQFWQNRVQNAPQMAASGTQMSNNIVNILQNGFKVAQRRYLTKFGSILGALGVQNGSRN